MRNARGRRFCIRKNKYFEEALSLTVEGENKLFNMEEKK
jgi:hypothetical protein